MIVVMVVASAGDFHGRHVVVSWYVVRRRCSDFTDMLWCLTNRRIIIIIIIIIILYGRPYCNDAKEGVGAITPPKLNRG